MEIGKNIWVIPEGYIPGWSNGPEPEMTSHEAACILNAGEEEARVEITVFFEDQEPAGPYEIVVPAKRTRHLRFNELSSPAIPRGTAYSSLLVSNTPIVVQHTRLDSRQSQNALLSTIAYAVG